MLDVDWMGGNITRDELWATLPVLLFVENTRSSGSQAENQQDNKKIIIGNRPILKLVWNALFPQQESQPGPAVLFLTVTSPETCPVRPALLMCASIGSR